MAEKTLLIGLTGPIGSGKSTVAKVWQANGAGIVEGDEMGRLALETAPELRQQLAERFGRDILLPDGSVNRPILAMRAFASDENSADLTRLTFPTLYRLAREQCEQLGTTHRIVVFDAALIFEWGVERDFDKIITVTAAQKDLICRVAGRLGITCAMADERLSRQLPPSEKARRADYVIVNDGTIEQLIEKAERVWREICLM